MKKLMMLAAITAMTAGAFADELDPLRTDGSYSFGLTITGIPDEYTKLSSNAGAYLVNAETKDIVAYFRFGDNTVEGVKSHDMLYQKAGETITLGGNQYKFADQILVKKGDEIIKPFVQEDAGTKMVSFKFNFQTSASTTSLPGTLGLEETTKGDSAEFGLFGIVYDPGTQDGYSAYYQEFHNLTYSRGPGLFDNNGSAKYTNSIPEPTSAMLLLLGFAGLALKRKRVA